MPECQYNPNYFMDMVAHIEENDSLRDPQRAAYAKSFQYFRIDNGKMMLLLLFLLG